jgi:hypothetical protein
MTDTANLGLPLIDAGQAQKHVTHNEALRAIDALAQLVVQSAAIATPPASPVNGHCWIVAASPTGAWAGKAGQIAEWVDGGWYFFPPLIGWTAYNIASGALLAYNGTTWVNALSFANVAMGRRQPDA